MNYDFRQLGPHGFQDLAATLGLKMFGPALDVMGMGRDGGRDMIFDGPLMWVSEQSPGGESWNGYTVFQVKHKDEAEASNDRNIAWLWTQVRSELDSWVDPFGDRSRLPDQLVFITNVKITPFPITGGFDRLQASVEAYGKSLENSEFDHDPQRYYMRTKKLERFNRIKRIKFWGSAQLTHLLNIHPGVRNAFPGFFTAADVFANLKDLSGIVGAEAIEPVLRTHCRASLTSDGRVYFDEAGGMDGVGVSVHRIATDLPIRGAEVGSENSAVRYILERGEHMLRPRGTSVQGPRHLLLTGAPGNGKTTLSKLLVQVFRASQLKGAEDLSVPQRSVIDGTEGSLLRMGSKLPLHRRWAMRIDLAEYAQEGGLDTQSTLLRWIAAKVSDRSDAGDIRPATLDSWMRTWPCFLVLDGLDEVSEPSMRRRLIEQVTEFVDEAEAKNSDLLVVLTTRPIGYTEHIAPSHFERIDLDYLETGEALKYGNLAIDLRLNSDMDRAQLVRKRLRDASEDETLKDLLRTPLQVLILTIIVEGSGSLAPDRYSLFQAYFETVLKREKEKVGGFSRLLREYQTQILQLHQRVGFDLQVRSETSNRPYATLSETELRDIAWQVLSDDGFDPSGVHADLLRQLQQAATHRLVLIAPRGAEGYGFDVRQLQELMAAVHLTNSSLEETVRRLRLAAASPHWRATWVFAAGRLFATPQASVREAITSLVENIDQGVPMRLGRIFRVGPGLALDLIDDGMARTLPKWRSRLMSVALAKLLETHPQDLTQMARVLVRYADASPEQDEEVARGLRSVLEAGGHRNVDEMRLMLAHEAIVLKAGIHVHALAHIKDDRSSNSPLPARAEPDWESFDAEIATAPVSVRERSLLQGVTSAILRISSGDTVEGTQEILAVLQSPVASAVLEDALAHVRTHTVTFVPLRDVVMSIAYRRPIGEEISLQ